MSIIVKLRNYAPHASSSESQIIKYILANPKRAIDDSIHDIAKNTYTSAASVTRLSKKIGCCSYKDFRNQLVAEVTIRDFSNINQSKEIVQNESMNDILDKVTGKHISVLEETRMLLDLKVLESVLDVLRETKTIFLFGIGSSFLVAKDFQQKMLRLGISCVLSEDYHMQLLQSQNIKSSDVAMVFSYSGQTKEIIEWCNNIKNRGATLIAITQMSRSRIDKISDFVLYVSSSEQIVRSGALTSRMSMLYVVDILYMAYIAREYEQALFNINKTQIEKE